MHFSFASKVLNVPVDTALSANFRRVWLGLVFVRSLICSIGGSGRGGGARDAPRVRILSLLCSFGDILAKSYVDTPRGISESATVYLILDFYFPLTNPTNPYTERGMTFDKLKLVAHEVLLKGKSAMMANTVSIIFLKTSVS